MTSSEGSSAFLIHYLGGHAGLVFLKPGGKEVGMLTALEEMPAFV